MAIKKKGGRYFVHDEQGKRISRGFKGRGAAARRDGTDQYKKHVRRMRG